MRKKLIILLFCTISCFLFIGCAPTGFVKAVDGGTWSSIMIREDLTYDQAFNEVMDVGDGHDIKRRRLWKNQLDLYVEYPRSLYKKIQNSSDFQIF